MSACGIRGASSVLELSRTEGPCPRRALERGDDWVGELRAFGVLAIAERPALERRRGPSLSPCVSCGAEKRGREDGRGPIGVRRDDLGWRCHRCDAHGDAVTLASWRLLGAAAPRRVEEWRTMRSWARAEGLIAKQGTPPRLPVAAIAGVGYAAASRPPAPEVLSLWNEAAGPVTRDRAAVRWLCSRGIGPRAVDNEDLARVVHRRARLPAWARFRGRPWTVDHRLLVPLYEPDGTVASVHARALGVIAAGGNDKAASPAGFDVSGLVMANGAARDLLRRGVGTGELVVVEGVPDFLRFATVEAKGKAVIGILAGSWSDELARRIPAGACVEVWTHEDAAGDRYAEAIHGSLAGRCVVERRSR